MFTFRYVRTALAILLVLVLTNCGGGGGEGSGSSAEQPAAGEDSADPGTGPSENDTGDTGDSGGSDAGDGGDDNNTDVTDNPGDDIPDTGGSDPLAAVFPKSVSLFGVAVYATSSTPNDALLHTARVLAKYLDNNEDGVPDNALVAERMAQNGAAMLVAANESELEQAVDQLPQSDSYQPVFVDEIHPGGAAQGVFDATLEEVLHLITHVGYAGIYPAEFGEAPGSVIADAMDAARGGRFLSIPSDYPESAWYTYDDQTCDYGCMVTEYFYWALTSILGGQDFAGRLEQIENEWKLNTRDKVAAGDAAVFALLTNSQYGLPTVLPDGQYNGLTLSVVEHN